MLGREVAVKEVTFPAGLSGRATARCCASAPAARPGPPPGSTTRAPSPSTTSSRRTARRTSSWSSSRPAPCPRSCAPTARCRRSAPPQVGLALLGALEAAHRAGDRPPRREAGQRPARPDVDGCRARRAHRLRHRHHHRRLQHHQHRAAARLPRLHRARARPRPARPGRRPTCGRSARRCSPPSRAGRRSTAAATRCSPSPPSSPASTSRSSRPGRSSRCSRGCSSATREQRLDRAAGPRGAARGRRQRRRRSPCRRPAGRAGAAQPSTPPRCRVDQLSQAAEPRRRRPGAGRRARRAAGAPPRRRRRVPWAPLLLVVRHPRARRARSSAYVLSQPPRRRRRPRRTPAPTPPPPPPSSTRSCCRTAGRRYEDPDGGLEHRRPAGLRAQRPQRPGAVPRRRAAPHAAHRGEPAARRAARGLRGLLARARGLAAGLRGAPARADASTAGSRPPTSSSPSSTRRRCGCSTGRFVDESGTQAYALYWQVERGRLGRGPAGVRPAAGDLPARLSALRTVRVQHLTARRGVPGGQGVRPADSIEMSQVSAWCMSGGDRRAGTRWHAVPRPRRHVVLGGSPRHRRPHLLLPVRARARHRAGPGLPRRLRPDHGHLQDPARQPHGGRPGRRGALPRAQRPAGHRHRLLGQGPALPEADDVGRRRRLFVVLMVPARLPHARATPSPSCSGAPRDRRRPAA